ncbi:TM2 domain-containing protein [Telluribacter humicola]|uniref:TM2 domain-containing protein n=1 Tax=Telluribacter humicola TaxID=1720261 RepID=UPI001A96092B|nr:TM2 domain-containing protein [Telluribacter humicola]
MKDKFVAGLLALLFGGFGLHRFYLGQTRLGVLYLLFCWTLIPFLIGIIDAFIFWFGSRHAFNLEHNFHAFSHTGAETVRLTFEDLERMQKSGEVA